MLKAGKTCAQVGASLLPQTLCVVGGILGGYFGVFLESRAFGAEAVEAWIALDLEETAVGARGFAGNIFRRLIK